MAEEPTIGGTTPDPNTGTPNDPNAGQGAGQTQGQTQERTLTAADLQAIAADVNAWQTRIDTANKERDEAKAALEKAVKEHADAVLAHRRERAVDEAIFKGHFGERINMGEERKFVNMDGVKWDEEGTMDGIPSYRPIPRLSGSANGLTADNALANIAQRQQQNGAQASPETAPKAIPAGQPAGAFDELTL